MRAIKFTKFTKFAKFALAIVPVLVTVLALTAGVAGANHDNGRVSLGDVRAATARYHSLSVAIAHKYGILKDAKGIACIDNPGVGAMGIHYVNGDLVGTTEVNPLKPEALVYEPQKNGRLSLVAVEYVTFQAQWDATHKAPPSLFGHRFMLTPDGNRFGLPAFYSLHAWIWKHNPDGTFAMWNPNVHCPSA
ncbi:MAG TPA: hypothetical protein VH349_08040 [Ktedonobacterales bacterium]